LCLRRVHNVCCSPFLQEEDSMIRILTKSMMALAIVVAIAGAPALATAQDISIYPATIDLGAMEQMQEKEASVTVTNNGDGQLIIQNVEADCGCTVPTLAKDTLGPGESTVINIVFNSKKFHGKIIKMVTIESNDRRKPITEVLLTANIRTALIVDPANLHVGFTRALGGEDRTKQVTFTATEEVDLEVNCSSTRKNEFDIRVINDFEGNSKVSVVEVTLPGDSAPGDKRDIARVNTNIEGFETVDLEIRGTVLDQISYRPTQVNFRYKKDFNASIRVAPEEKGLIFKVTKAEIDLPEIEVIVTESIPNEVTMVQLKGSPIARTDPRAKATKGRIKGTLTIYTNASGTPKMEIPVSYMVRM
jgi:uncharacterized protein DUF1573